MTQPIVKVKKLHENATIPQYKTDGAAGLDLSVVIDKDTENSYNTNMDYRNPLWSITIAPRCSRRLPTGLTVSIPEGYEGQVRTRSGMALKKGLVVLNSPGTIDSDYRGPLDIILYNCSDNHREIRHGDRVAQLVICPVAKAFIEEVEELTNTQRGEGGFGSTGID